MHVHRKSTNSDADRHIWLLYWATDRIVGLEMGADDYITKPFNPREVVARVRAVLRRMDGAAAPARQLRIGALSLDLDRHIAQVGGAAVDLTPTEFDLLKTFMENPDRVLSRSDLIEKGLG